jgi:hypothetical protein
VTTNTKPLGSIAIPAEWPAPERLLRRAELAEFLGVTKEVIRGWERRGHGPPKVADGVFGRWEPVFYRAGDVREWFDRAVRPVSPTAEPETALGPSIDERRAAALRRVQELLATEAEEEPVAYTPIYDVGDDDEDFEPFSQVGRAPRRRGPGGYFSG